MQPVHSQNPSNSSSVPDTWGRTLMQRREPQRAKEEERKPRKLHDIDYLLGVYDESRMGALRFKLDPNGPFLDTGSSTTTPPWTNLSELQEAVRMIESDDDEEHVRKWILMLNTKQMEEILTQIISVVAKWRIHATQIGISKKEQEIMQPAFKF